MIDPGLPGAELVAKGIDDLQRGEVTAAALLVSIGAPRLRQLGLEIAAPLEEPEHRLWALLAREGPTARMPATTPWCGGWCPLSRHWHASLSDR